MEELPFSEEACIRIPNNPAETAISPETEKIKLAHLFVAVAELLTFENTDLYAKWIKYGAYAARLYQDALREGNDYLVGRLKTEFLEIKDHVKRSNPTDPNTEVPSEFEISSNITENRPLYCCLLVFAAGIHAEREEVHFLNKIEQLCDIFS